MTGGSSDASGARASRSESAEVRVTGTPADRSAGSEAGREGRCSGRIICRSDVQVENVPEPVRLPHRARAHADSPQFSIVEVSKRRRNSSGMFEPVRSMSEIGLDLLRQERDRAAERPLTREFPDQPRRLRPMPLCPKVREIHQPHLRRLGKSHVICFGGGGQIRKSLGGRHWLLSSRCMGQRLRPASAAGLHRSETIDPSISFAVIPSCAARVDSGRGEPLEDLQVPRTRLKVPQGVHRATNQLHDQSLSGRHLH